MKSGIITAMAGIMILSTAALADGNISGTVVNKNSSEPIDFATVTILDHSDNRGTPISGTSTGSDGSFTFRDIRPGRYIVRVTNMGSITDEIEITVTDSDIDLGQIELADDSRLLEEVVVTGQKSQLSVSSERRVFNVSSDIASAGASAGELLASVPSVDVSHDGEISLRGNSDVTVWINGKESGMTADNRMQMLSQIPAESIESIEVMTNPASKHGAEGTAGIINIRLKEGKRAGYYGSAEADADTRGNVNVNVNSSLNTGRFETFASLGFKSRHNPGGSESRRNYDNGTRLDSDGSTRKHENSLFARIGANYSPDSRSTLYLSAAGTLGHIRSNTGTSHFSDLPSQWSANLSRTREHGFTRGANILAGYRLAFTPAHSIDMNVSYNTWQGSTESDTRNDETWPDGSTEMSEISQHQRVRINNWEAAVDYSGQLAEWLRLEAGYKGNYNHENSPASYWLSSASAGEAGMPDLYNRFKYDTDISALYVSLSGSHGVLSYSAGLRGEMWSIRTRSLGYGETDGDAPLFSKNDFALFPSASVGWAFTSGSELRLDLSRRIRRPYGPQLNTFENVSDPSEVHLGNPLIQPQYSDALELTYMKTWSSHMLSASAYVRSSKDKISHVSFLAPMSSDPEINTMYYGHANVGDMLDTGVEIISRNSLWNTLTLTTTVNLHNNRMKAWSTEYPLHGAMYTVSGEAQNRFVWDIRCMASVRLPWDLTFQATGRYNSRRTTAQGSVEPAWDVEAGLRKSFGPWNLSLVCKDIFASKKSHEILYGDGYRQSIEKWTGGRTLRLAVSYTFGKKSAPAHDTHNHIDTGGYGEGHSH